MRIDAESSNSYGTLHDTDADVPSTPWAMNLAADGLYHYLCFDFDANRGNAGYDAGRMSHWLDELNIDHLVCISGPSGGRHVWISLETGLDPAIAATIAQLAGQLLASLDTTPLCNAATGCVRPPLSPHRRGGRSEPQGPLDAILRHGVDESAVDQLRALLIDAGAALTPPPASLVKGMVYDADRHPRLAGAKRPLSPRLRALLASAPADDASRTQAAVLVGCARARWTWADLAAIVDDAPALEHTRSRPAPGGRRVARPRHTTLKLLEADWHRAVYFAASNPVEYDGKDSDFPDRAAVAAAAIAACQESADATPGRWGNEAGSRASRVTRGRASHRAVLDAVCLYIAQSTNGTVEVDSRRLSADTGYGRETCRLALLALASSETGSAWLEMVDPAHGIHGARFRLASRFSTEESEQKWAQAAMRPAPTSASGPALRTWWINRLGGALSAMAHDVFSAPHSLGRAAGRVFASVPTEGALNLAEADVGDAGRFAATLSVLERLESVGLVTRSSELAWARPAVDLRDVVSDLLRVDGYLADRARRYSSERAVWGWWQAEVTWLARPRKSRRRRPSAFQVELSGLPLRETTPRYPRGVSGRPDHRAARKLVATSAPPLPSAA